MTRAVLYGPPALVAAAAVACSATLLAIIRQIEIGPRPGPWHSHPHITDTRPLAPVVELFGHRNHGGHR